MKKTIPAAIALLAAFYSPPEARAQSIGPSTINSAGGGNASGTLSYSIGQVVTTPNSASLIVTSGVLQPAMMTNSVRGVTALSGVDIFPNPVTTDLFVAPSFGARGVLEMTLFDAAGRMVRQMEANLATGNERQTIPMESFAASTYTLRLVWTAEGGQPAATAYTVQKVR